ncbi:MAG: spore maturation protein CgeB [Myxococcota bacterium]|jgi:spore maturation protein CgeB
MRPCSVAVVGSDQPGGMCQSIIEGFEANGIKTELIPYSSWFPKVHKVGWRGTGILQGFVHDAVRGPYAGKLVALLDSHNPDFVLFIKADNISSLAFRALRAAYRRPLVAFHPDDPFNTGTLIRPGPSHRNAINQMEFTDLYLSWSWAVLDKAKDHGATRTEYLPFACDPELHRVPELTEADREVYGSDVTFVGNWDTERERVIGPLAERCAAAGIKLAIWGSAYWERCEHPAAKAAWRGRPLLGEEMAKAARASALNLNILRAQNKGETNMRTFEVPCSGGFILHERSPALDHWLPPGKACAQFSDAEEAFTQIRHYLDHPKEREQIRQRGHEIARAWTYKEWTAKILDWVEQLPPR